VLLIEMCKLLFGHSAQTYYCMSHFEYKFLYQQMPE